MKKLYHMTALAVIFIIAASTACYANAGTPLMWFNIFHLLIANSIFGIVEGLIITKYFKTSCGKTVLLMIIANYLSAFGGYLLLSPVFYYLIEGPASNSLFSADLYNALPIVICVSILFFILTVFLELPFVYLMLRKHAFKIKKILMIAFLVQIPTNLFLLIGYMRYSDFSLYTQVDICRDCIELDGDYLIYYLQMEESGIFSFDTKTGKTDKLKNGKNYDKLNKIDAFFQQLYIDVDENGKGYLYTNDRKYNGKDESEKIVLVDNLNIKVPPQRTTNTDYANCVGHCENSARCGFWASEGLDIMSDTPKRGHADLHIAFETPILQWPCRKASLINDKYVIYQLGEQIVLFDIQNKRIQKLFNGKNPIVVIPD